MQNSCIDHWNVVICILRYPKKALGQVLLYADKGTTQNLWVLCRRLAGFPMDRRSTIGCCVLLGRNIISWKNKKQNVVIHVYLIFP